MTELTDNRIPKILFSSQTGNAEELAIELSNVLNGVEVYNMSDVEIDTLLSFGSIIIITSTYGEGEHPDGGQILWNSLQDVKDLSSIEYSVLGLGDRGYDFFCQTAEDWDNFFYSRGAKRVLETLKLDVDYEEYSSKWMQDVKNHYEDSIVSYQVKYKKDTKVENTKLIHKKDTPAECKLIDKQLLSGKLSDKEVYHFVFDINNTDINYTAGDTLGVIPLNKYSYIDSLLSVLGLDDKDYFIDGISLKSLLREKYEIRKPSNKLLEYIAENTTESLLSQLINNKALPTDIETIDVLINCKLSFTALEFVNLLNPLQYRYYSISSSPIVHKGEIHLTVKIIRYMFNNRKCEGVCTSFLADTLNVGDRAKIFVCHNKNFSVPETDVEMIMVGPGVGIAPFRGFIYERLNSNSTGLNWLFYGDRTKRNDYLYKDELESWCNGGKLKLSLAWSRDQDKSKFYVQDIMLNNGKKIYDLLEKGAYFFVCGDALHMAKDVEAALLEIISTYGAMSVDKAKLYINNLGKTKRYIRDVY